MTPAAHPLGRRAVLLGTLAAAGASVAGCAAASSAPAPAPRSSVPADDPALRVTDTDWTTLPAGAVPATDPQGRRYLQTRVPATVGPATVGGPRGPGLRADLPDGRSASYVLQDLARPLVELGAVFAIGPGNGLGSLCLARFDRWTEDVGSRGELRSTCHLGITPERWTYGVFRSSHLEVVESRPLRTPIAVDGSPHTMRVVVSGSTASVVEPDGRVVTVDDPRIATGQAESYACWEFFKLAPGAGDITFLRTCAR